MSFWSHEFQSIENKSTLEMLYMSPSFSSIPDVSSGVPRGPYSGCCPSWGWRLMVDVCPCAHDVCRSWGSLAQVRLLICHQIAPRARLVNLPSAHTWALYHTSVHTDTKDTLPHTSLQCHTTPSAPLRTLAEGHETVGWAPSAPIFTQCALVHACLTKHTCLECICHTNVPISKVAWKFSNTSSLT